MLHEKNISILTIMVFLVSVFALAANAKILFKDDFESDTIGKPPANWIDLGAPKGYAGGGLSVVEADPLNPNNKVFHLIPKAFDTNSHNIWAVHDGDKSWVNYVWEFDWLFPEDTYCPVDFRLVNVDEFCQVSRRPGHSEFHIYTHTAQSQWLELRKYTFSHEDLKWYRVQISVKDKEFTFKIKELNDKTTFDKLKEPDVMANTMAGELFPYGGVGLQEGYKGIVDNIAVGETAGDIQAVEYSGKMAICWGKLKF